MKRHSNESKSHPGDFALLTLDGFVRDLHGIVAVPHGWRAAGLSATLAFVVSKSSSEAFRLVGPGPFLADQIRDGDPYELSNGHAIQCMAGGQSHGRTALLGGSVLDTDAAVESAGVHVGFSPEEKLLRVPDIAVGNVEARPGWGKTMPLLAVEVADVGQDEADLKVKIEEYFAHGTLVVWVVRNVGPRRVEVHEQGLGQQRKTYTAQVGEDLLAPGILQNPVPVLAFFEREHAHEATLRNLLNRKGYASLEDVRRLSEERGEERGEERILRQAIGDLCEVLSVELTPARAHSLSQMSRGALDGLRAHLKQHRSWPGSR